MGCKFSIAFVLVFLISILEAKLPDIYNETSTNYYPAIKGQTIPLQCSDGEGDFDFTYKLWVLPSGEVLVDGTSRLVISKSNLTLTIKDIQPSDAGSYQCVGEIPNTSTIIKRDLLVPYVMVRKNYAIRFAVGFEICCEEVHG